MKDSHKEITSLILKSCFEVINELGPGFLETVYKNALAIALKDNHFLIEFEKPIEVYFRDQRVGLYKPDMIVQNCVIVELKCCKNLLPEHQAQLINYLKATGISIGLLVNFGTQKLEFRRLHHPTIHTSNCTLAQNDLDFVPSSCWR